MIALPVPASVPPAPPVSAASPTRYRAGDIVTICGSGHFAGRVGPVTETHASDDGRQSLMVDVLRTHLRTISEVSGRSARSKGPAGAIGGTLSFDAVDVRMATAQEMETWRFEEWPSARRYGAVSALPATTTGRPATAGGRSR